MPRAPLRVGLEATEPIQRLGGHVRNATHLRSVIALLEQLPPESGFEPYSLVALAYGDEEAKEHVRRSFRYEFGTCCAHLTVDGRAPSVWRANVLEGLGRAGYETWFTFRDSVDLRRWLRSPAERRRELALLAELGARGDGTRWPARRKREAPRRDEGWREPRASWLRIARQVCGAGLAWDEVSMCLSRNGRRAVPGNRGTWDVRVSLVPILGNASARRMFVSVDLSPRRRESWKKPLPPGVATLLRRVLQEAGFAPDGVRSAKTGRRFPGRVGYCRTYPRVREATRACRDVFDTLMRVELPNARA
jgi:hypothetical protein